MDILKLNINDKNSSSPLPICVGVFVIIKINDRKCDKFDIARENQ